MSFTRAYTPVLHFSDINGRPLVGGLLNVYVAGTSTRAATYRDKEGTLVNENPLRLDERGECVMFLDDSLKYKFVLEDSIGTVVWEEDYFSSPGASSGGEANVDVTGTYPISVTGRSYNGVTSYEIGFESRELEAAKTEVVAGDNIDVNSYVAQDGHTVYEINRDRDSQLFDSNVNYEEIHESLTNGCLPYIRYGFEDDIMDLYFYEEVCPTWDYVFRSLPSSDGTFFELRMTSGNVKTLSTKSVSGITVIDYADVTFVKVQSALQDKKHPIVKRTTDGITVYHDLIVSSTVTNEFLFRSSPAKDGGFAEIRVFNDNTKSYTIRDMIHNCVQVNAAQTFTDAEKAQARANIGAVGSCLLTPPSDWQTLTGTDVTLRNIWSTNTPEAVTGNKIRLGINIGQTKYSVEMAKLGAYRFDVILHVKWDGTPVNKTGTIFGIAVDFSRPFETIIGRQSTVIEVSGTEHKYYSFGFEVPASSIDAPNGVKLAIQVLAEYLGPVPAAEAT